MKTNDFSLGDQTPWRLLVPQNTKPDWAVLWLQGFTSTIEGHSEGCARMSEATRVTFAILNYAGHGNHPVKLEDATRKQQFDEVLAVYDELIERGYKKIIVIGGSFGGYMAALLSGERKISGLVLRAPAVYLDEEFEVPYVQTQESVSQEKKDVYRTNFNASTSSKALDSVRNYTGDTFVIEHELDEVVNRSIPLAYYQVAQHGNYIVIRGCKHSPKLMDDPQHYFAIIENWLTTIVVNIIQQSE